MATTQAQPSLTVEMRLDTPLYIYDLSEPPNMLVRTRSHCSRPITMYTRRTVLASGGGHFRCHLFKITHAKEGKRYIQREYATPKFAEDWENFRSGKDDSGFKTLDADEAIVQAFNFDSDTPALPAWDPRRLKFGRDKRTKVCGVDNLLPNNVYKVELDRGLNIGWWRWGEMEDVRKAIQDMDCPELDETDGFDMEVGEESYAMLAVGRASSEQIEQAEYEAAIDMAILDYWANLGAEVSADENLAEENADEHGSEENKTAGSSNEMDVESAN